MDNNMPIGPVGATLRNLGAVGAENAVSTRDLMAEMGLKDVRAFRSMIEDERNAGDLILANGRGLFLPDAGDKGREEVRRWIALMVARISGAARTLKAARGSLRRIEGQTEISEDAET